jgi:hypothetical protein
VRRSARHVIHDDDHIFEFDIEQADLGHWEEVGTPTTYAVRQRWEPASGSPAGQAAGWSGSSSSPPASSWR